MSCKGVMKANKSATYHDILPILWHLFCARAPMDKLQHTFSSLVAIQTFFPFLFETHAGKREGVRPKVNLFRAAGSSSSSSSSSPFPDGWLKKREEKKAEDVVGKSRAGCLMQRKKPTFMCVVLKPWKFSYFFKKQTLYYYCVYKKAFFTFHLLTFVSDFGNPLLPMRTLKLRLSPTPGAHKNCRKIRALRRGGGGLPSLSKPPKVRVHWGPKYCRKYKNPIVQGNGEYLASDFTFYYNIFLASVYESVFLLTL